MGEIRDDTIQPLSVRGAVPAGLVVGNEDATGRATVRAHPVRTNVKDLLTRIQLQAREIAGLRAKARGSGNSHAHHLRHTWPRSWLGTGGRWNESAACGSIRTMRSARQVGCARRWHRKPPRNFASHHREVSKDAKTHIPRCFLNTNPGLFAQAAGFAKTKCAISMACIQLCTLQRPKRLFGPPRTRNVSINNRLAKPDFFLFCGTV